MSKDEPAFPRSYSHDGHNGMSLRDYFAGQALAGDWASQDGELGPFNNGDEQSGLETRASLYYRMADAMLAARNKGGDADG